MAFSIKWLLRLLFWGGLACCPLFSNAQNYQLVWADEFDYSGHLDTGRWFHQTQLPIPGSWYNGEIQHYTDRIENTAVNNGRLYLTAIAETYTDQGITKEHTSARLNSKFTFTYGKVEVRAKLPAGVGTWPAIWMLGQNISEPGAYWETQGYGTTSWPACGEIDIMEHWGHNQDYVSSAIHTPSSYGGTVNVGGRFITGASDTFHVYAMEWTADSIVFSVDGQVHYTYAPSVKDADTWPFDDPQYILMNVAILPTIDPNFTQSAMEVDYVRVYQRPTTTGRASIVEPTLLLSPNPVQSSVNLTFSAPLTTPADLLLYDAMGQLVRSRTLPATSSSCHLSNLESLPGGTYQVLYRSRDQIVRTSFLKL